MIKGLENYLKDIPSNIVNEWLVFFGEAFVTEHIREARIWEMANQKKDRDRKKFLTNWLINARKDEKKMHEEIKASGNAMLSLAEEMKKNRESKLNAMENMGL